MSIEAKVVEAVSKVSKKKPEDVSLDSRFEQLGMDSLDMNVLLYEVEAAFDMTIAEEDVQGVETVGDIVKRLEAKLGGAPPASGGTGS